MKGDKNGTSLLSLKKRSNAGPAAATLNVVDTPTDITSENSILDNDKFVKSEFSDKLQSRSEQNKII